MVSGSGREIEWTSFNKPSRIKTKDADVSFEYGPDNNRVSKQSLDKQGQETTWYVGKGYEIITAVDMDGNHIERKKHFIYADGEVIAIQVRTIENGQKQADQTRYLHKDALGSVDTITDSHGAVIARMGYTPFGQRRAVNGQEIDQSFQRKLTNRGYTGHEQIDNIGLVHMNARLYDPEIGRFLSADIYIQEPGLSQNFNRYIYVMNNPLKYNDPSGHFINFIIGAIIMIVSQFIDNPYIRMIGMVVGMAMMGGAFGGAQLFTASANGAAASGSFVVATGNATANGIIAGALNGAAIGAVVGGATTGTLTGALKGAAFGAISGAAAGYIGHGNGGDALFNSKEATALAHGISQGAISEMRGGKFKSGFVGAFIAHMSPATRWAKTNAVPMPIRTMTAAVLGGLASAATGGSFSDGAYHGAMVHLFNAELRNISNGDGPTKIRYESRTANGKVFRVPVYDVACNSTCASSNANVVWSDHGSQGWAHAMAAETGRDLASLVGNVASLVVLKTPLSVVGRSAGRLGDAGSIVKSLIVQDATAIIPIFTGKAASSYLQAGGWGASSATRFGTAASAVQGEYLPQ
ncbi:MAG: RHS repeat-associated core domain-containing protein [gamma proteobacterium endosymbiont of Lamellibrachia anaximandri]|nr:RHS repeat-associated core domain-containing protein [gamma proteobacterium endosymbiont of Lamellibrachia anaximandri]